MNKSQESKAASNQLPVVSPVPQNFLKPKIRPHALKADPQSPESDVTQRNIIFRTTDTIISRFNEFRFRGIIFALISGFFLSSGAAFVKSIENLFSLEIIVIR